MRYLRNCRWGICLVLSGALLTGVAFTVSGQIDSTRYVTVADIHTEGNFRTRTSIILRELSFRKGDSLQLYQLPVRLEVERRKVVNTNLFVTVRMIPVFAPDSSTLTLTVAVKERWYLLGLPVFELADRNFNEWWYDRNRDFRRITYGGYVSYGNVTGRSDRLRLLVELGFVPKYEISYAIPYIDRKMKIGLLGGASYLTNKSLAFRTWNDKLDFLSSEAITRRRFYAFVASSYRSKFYGYHTLDLRWHKASVADTVLRLNPDYTLDGAREQRYFQLTYTYSYDKRDIGQYPLRGNSFVLQLSKRGLFHKDNVNQGYLYAAYRHYFPLGGRWFFNSGVRLRAAFPAGHPYLNMIGLGYKLDLVRGYELYVIDGQHYGILQNELKFRVFEVQKHIRWLPRQFGTIPLALYVNSFADMGYIRNPYPERSNSRLGNSYLAGAGIGLDLVTFYNMVYRVNYTVNKSGEARFFLALTKDF